MRDFLLSLSSDLSQPVGENQLTDKVKLLERNGGEGLDRNIGKFSLIFSGNIAFLEERSPVSRDNTPATQSLTCEKTYQKTLMPLPKHSAVPLQANFNPYAKLVFLVSSTSPFSPSMWGSSQKDKPSPANLNTKGIKTTQYLTPWLTKGLFIIIVGASARQEQPKGGLRTNQLL